MASAVHGDTVENTFRLLVPATGPVPPGGHAVELGGVWWVPTEYTTITNAAQAPPYTCISYSWGRGRTAHPLQAGHTMSDRAMPALEAAIRALRPPAIWLDALCVPLDEPARAACLRSMGAIYGAAAQVVAVFSAQTSAVLDEISSTARLQPQTLLLLENDEWVTRAWTYQEIVNSKRIDFIAEGGRVAPVAGDQLLNVVGQAIDAFKKAQGFDAFRMRALYPRLDSLEDLIADYLTAGYLERSAYQAMSAMDRRFAQQADDQFHALLGAITAEPLDGQDDSRLHPAECFMRVCEAKGDFSFIFCNAPRSAVVGRRWRPVAGPIPAVFPWHSYGDGQTGALHPTHLQLDGMGRLHAGAVDADAAKLVDWWLQRDSASASSAGVTEALLERLRSGGFTGCGECLQFEAGYVFPQSPLRPDEEPVVVVATGVKWVQGAPALLLRATGTDVYDFRDVGVFVGRVPKDGAPIRVA